MRWISKRVPELRYVRIEPNARLPFADKSFDIAASNAVLEHISSAENQRLFVREIGARRRTRVILLLITVPNRYFPVEHHTAVPLLHYSDRAFKFRLFGFGQVILDRHANLILMTRKRLWRLAAELPMSVAVGYTGLRFGPICVVEPLFGASLKRVSACDGEERGFTIIEYSVQTCRGAVCNCFRLVGTVALNPPGRVAVGLIRTSLSR